VLTAVPLCDGHDSAILTINRELVRAGVEVVYLGYNRSATAIARAAVQEDVAAVGISSYNGGHIEFFAEVRRRLDGLGGGRIRLFGGGGGVITADDFAVMRTQGTDAVFMAGTPLDAITARIAAEYRPAVPPPLSADDLARCRAGDPEAIGRLMSRIEAGEEGDWVGGRDNPVPLSRESAGQECPAHRDVAAPSCRVIGFAGPGGAGKSTLIDELLIRHLSAHPTSRAAVLSTDPGSPVGTGALLGDRTSLLAANGDRVYYRCFAARGSGTGVAGCVPAAAAALRGLGAFGLVLVESLGTGQDADAFRVRDAGPPGGPPAGASAEVRRWTDAAVFVMTPEYGSPIQLDKIAMLETADAVALNKADRPTSATATAEVTRRVRRSRPGGIPVFPTIARRHRDPGVDRLYGAVVEDWRG
jgi:methylmalonyl-CoA mutase